MLDLSLIQDSELFAREIVKMPIHKTLIEKYATYDFSEWSIGVAHVFAPNTLPLLLALLKADPDLTVILNNGNVYDQATVRLMRKAGIHIVDSEDKVFDFVIDCGGYFSTRPPRFGSVEVTRSGIHKYLKNSLSEFILLDSDNSQSKLIETFLGNPEAVERTFGNFIDNYQDFLVGKSFAVIGFGKIGRGIAQRFRKFGSVTVLDIDQDIVSKAKSLGYEAHILTESRDQNSELLETSDIIFTATGYPNIGTQYFEKSKLQTALKINIGAVDEWGEEYSESEIYHSKYMPFNFNLTPPTDSKYIDPILSAQLEGLRFLIQNYDNLTPGYLSIPKEIDQKIVTQFENEWNEKLDVVHQYFDLD